MNYFEFISEYNIPLSTKNFAIFLGVITSGIAMLFKNNHPPPKNNFFLIKTLFF